MELTETRGTAEMFDKLCIRTSSAQMDWMRHCTEPAAV
ncbi:hypothetical protein CHK_1339 [Christensenella hongkongensis]|uniref:Uncharacterized protein n=1 Tax=Christensenella hongkongensis TaxID=270498 RepID=A0A0M2NKH5_9FIRM|nr:hypothetical protein CHK_1339 [Christensenella hongkongensis]